MTNNGDRIAFIGTGNMGTAMIRCAVDKVNPANIVLSNRTKSKAERVAAEFHCSVADSNVEACKGATYIVLGVKPHLMEGVLTEIADVVKKSDKLKAVITLAAGKTINFYKQVLGYNGIIRFLPNTPCMIGEGILLVARDKSDVSDEKVKQVMDIFNSAGVVKEIDENMVDACGTIAGCTPAFVNMFIEALADGAVMSGVPRADALVYAAQAVKGTASLLLKTGKHPGELKDAVCSPGGSTIVGVRTCEDGGLRSAAMNAVYNAYVKTKELA